MSDTFPDIGVEQAEMGRSVNWAAQAAGVQRRLPIDAGRNASEFARSYPTTTPDPVAATAMTGLRGHGDVAELMRRDAVKRGTFERLLNNTVGRVSRPVTALFYDGYDLGVSRWLRFGTQMFQGDADPVDDFLRAGSGIAGQAARAMSTRQGSEQELTPGQLFGGQALGTGLIAGRSQEVLGHPGAGKYLEDLLKRNEDKGGDRDFEDMYDETEQWVADRYGADVVARAYESAEATRLHVTSGGARYETGVSVGRLAVLPAYQVGLLTPDTVAANLISGGFDVAAQIGLDPWDSTFNALTRMRSGRAALIPAQISSTDEAIAANGGIRLQDHTMRGPYHGRDVPAVLIGGGGRREVGHAAEGYVFHGGEQFEGGFSSGGMTYDLARSIGYAETTGANVPTVNVFRTDQIPTPAQKHLEEIGEIEQWVGPFNLEGDEADEVADFIAGFDEGERLVADTVEAERLFEEQLYVDNPELAQWKTEFDEWDELSPMERQAQGRTLPKTPREALTTYGTAAEVAESVRLQDDAIEAYASQGELVWESIEIAQSPRTKAAIQAHVWGGDFGDPSGLLTRGDWNPEPIAQIPLAEAQEMLNDGYLFLEGKGARDAAFKFTDEQIGVTKVRGRYHAKNATEWLGSKQGNDLAEWLADARVAEHHKFVRLRDAGVPESDVMQFLSSMRPVTDEAGTTVTLTPGQLKGESTNALTQWVNNQRLVSQVRRPGPLAKILPASPAFIGNSVTAPAPIRKFSDWGRRWAAHSTDSVLDPWDFDKTSDAIIQWMRTTRASDAEIDRIMRLAYEVRNDYRGMNRVQSELLDSFKKRLRKTGSTEDEAVKIITDYFDEQDWVVKYNVDAAANPIAERDSMWKVYRRSGDTSETFSVAMDQPLLDSELAMTNVRLPSIREVRRVTAGPRRLMDKMRTHPLGFDKAWSAQMVDSAVAIWRDFQLLRPGWMLSVTPDEMARFAAQGHTDLLRNPFFMFSFLFRKAADQLPTGGRTLDEIIEAQGGLGAGGFGRTIKGDEVAVKGPGMGKAEGKVWSATDVYEYDDAGRLTDRISEDGAKALARNHVQLYQSTISRKLLEFDGDIDRTFEYFRAHPDGQQVIDDITRGVNGEIPDPNKRLGKLRREHRKPTTDEGKAANLEADQALQTELQAVDARIHLMTGGRYVKREYIGGQATGGWVDHNGIKVEMYDGIDPQSITPENPGGSKWTKARMMEEIRLRDPEASNLFSMNGQRVTAGDLRERLLSMDGYKTGTFDVPPAQQYVITKKGDQEMRNILQSGRRSVDELTPNQVRTYAVEGWVRSHNVPQSEAAYIVMSPAQYDALLLGDDLPTGTVQVSSNAARAGIETKSGNVVVLVDSGKLEPDVQLALWRGEFPEAPLADYMTAAMTPDELSVYSARVVEQSEVVHIADDMDIDQLEAYEQFVRDEAFTDDVRAPAQVKGPSKAQTQRLDGAGERFINNAFKIIGANPSNAIRHPYARIRVWEAMADYYLFAAPGLRDDIAAYVADIGMSPKEFTELVGKSMRKKGLKTIPAPAKTQLSLAEIEKVAVAQAINETKELFFNLAQRGNWADATKIVFPFGDAWWEIITRWGKLMNPMMAEEFGQPIRNLRRIQSATMGAERAGWFETNERGERVFRWFPSASMATKFLGLPQGAQMVGQASMNQLGFIDFSETRGIMGPGMGPFIQIPAAMIAPFLPPAIRDMQQWAIHGSYDPNEYDAEGFVDSFLPTYLKKLFYRVTGGMEDERYAGIQIDIANGFAASGDPMYADAATDPVALSRLMKDSQRVAGWVGAVDILVASISPLQARNVVQVVNQTTKGTEQVVNMLTVSGDYRMLLQYFEVDQARRMILDWYGEDPISVAAKSYRVQHREVTTQFATWNDKNPDAEEFLPFNMAAFAPESTVSDYSSQEYQRQIETGSRQRLTPLESQRVLSYNAGSHRMEQLEDERDQRLLEAENKFGKDSDLFKAYRDDTVTPWYNMARVAISSQYHGFQQQGTGPVGLMKRPTQQMIKDEMLALGTLGTQENRVARALDPKLTKAMEQVSIWWRANGDTSIQMGHGDGWWYSSTAIKDPDASMLRSVFKGKVFELSKSLDEVTQRKFSWFADYVIASLMTGYDRDAPFIVEVDPLLSAGGE